jgi:MSHA biogenesis protein MshL
MKHIISFCIGLVLAACSAPAIKTKANVGVTQEMNAAVTESITPSRPEAVSEALLPPLTMSLPRAESMPAEGRFDLAVNNTPAKEVFAAIGSGTRYNLLPLPGINGNITLNLKDVTIFEALDTIRELYGYEYKIEGKNIYIQSVELQIRLFKIDYLAAMRDSSSSLTVKASGQTGTSAQGTASQSTAATQGSAATNNASTVSTRQTSAEFNFWENLDTAIKSIITPNNSAPNQGDRSVVINRMSGVIVVRALPEELRNVAEFLKASQLSVERQVIIEAKFVEVTLSEGLQTGVNWAAFSGNGSSNISAGLMGQGSTLVPNAAGGVAQSMNSAAFTSIPGSSLTAAGTGSSLFGMAFQANNFAAMLNFLESQGSVHILSSPRISTLNNQKAVLKVGTDEPYVTGYTPGTSTVSGGGTTGTLPTPIYSQIFSGIALDVTPRINERDEIILHVHPSISLVTSVIKDAGSGTTIQMASTSIEETDSVVHARDGQIVVIGGLMSQKNTEGSSGWPGWIKSVFGQTARASEKRELIILLKPTVVNNNSDWSADITRSRDRINSMSR